MAYFSSFRALFLAFFSKDLYRDVLLRWRGFGLTHLLLLNIIVITPAIFYVTFNLNAMIFDGEGQPSPYVTGIIDEVSAQIPLMLFKNGELSTDVAQPHVISAHIDDELQALAIIDLDASLETLRSSTAFILLTRDAVHLRKEQGEMETRYWSDLLKGAPQESFALDAESAHHYAYEAISWLQDNKLWIALTFGLIGWAATLLVMFIYRVIQALIFGGAVIVCAGMLKVPLTYQDAVRLTCVAISPPILADAALAAVLGQGISLPLFLLLTLGYCFFAVYSNKELSQAK